MKKRIRLFTVLIYVMISATILIGCQSQDEPKPATLAVLKSIELKKAPAKTQYTLGENINLAGIALEGTYSDNSKKAVAVSEANVSGFDSSKPADAQTITIKVENLSATFSVKILPMRVENGVLVEILPGYKTLEIPVGVTALKEKLFQQNTEVEKVILPEGLTSIAKAAFGWSAVKEVVFPSTLENIEKYAFYDCKNLKTVDLSKTRLKKITEETFVGAGIETLIMPNTLVEIGYQAFMDNGNLTRLELPYGLKVIGLEAFREVGLKNLSLPNSIQHLDQRAFYYCKSLETVTTFGEKPAEMPMDVTSKIDNECFTGGENIIAFAIPTGIRQIGGSIIVRCSKLTQLSIPSSVKKIGFGAFDNSGVNDVLIESETPAEVETVSGMWYGFPSGAKLKVAAGAVEKYKQATGWKQFQTTIKAK